MHAQESHDDYVRVTKCEPLGPKESIKGTWFVGFEESLFRIDYGKVPADVGNRNDIYRLIAPEPLNTVAHEKDAVSATAYQITFVGRKSLLPPLGGQSTIVLDNVISIHPVNRVPYRG